MRLQAVGKTEASRPFEPVEVRLGLPFSVRFRAVNRVEGDPFLTELLVQLAHRADLLHIAPVGRTPEVEHHHFFPLELAQGVLLLGAAPVAQREIGGGRSYLDCIEAARLASGRRRQQAPSHQQGQKPNLSIPHHRASSSKLPIALIHTGGRNPPWTQSRTEVQRRCRGSRQEKN